MSETKRETHKDITFMGKRFRIKKMDARQGTYVAFQLRSFLPAVFAIMDKSVDKSVALVNAMQAGMSRSDFYALENDALSVVFHVGDAGEIPVLDPSSGSIVNPDLAEDAQTLLVLVLQSIHFNVKGFFDESFQKEFVSILPSTKPSTVKTSPNS